MISILKESKIQEAGFEVLDIRMKILRNENVNRNYWPEYKLKKSTKEGENGYLVAQRKDIRDNWNIKKNLQ